MRTIAIFTLAGLFCLAAPVGGAQQMIIGPAPKAPVNALHFRCQFAIAVGGGRLAARRDLDADGRVVTQSAQWTDGRVGDRTNVPNTSVQWVSDAKAMSFEQGTANLYFYGAATMESPL